MRIPNAFKQVLRIGLWSCRAQLARWLVCVQAFPVVWGSAGCNVGLYTKNIYLYIDAYIQTYISTYVRTYIHACIHTYIRTYTYIHTYMHRYIHA